MIDCVRSHGKLVRLRCASRLAVDERRQDERGDDEADYLHNDEHRHRLARDARERFAETAGD